jgi:hypothetical protein
MPIVRSYMCDTCAHQMTITLRADQWDTPPPDCPVCISLPMQQEFRPVAIGGSASARAHAIAEDIVTNDYHAADFQREHRPEGTPKVRYRDQKPDIPASTWSGPPAATLQEAISIGRHTRLNYGSGLDVLQSGLKNGTIPDLIANSKKRAMRVY